MSTRIEKFNREIQRELGVIFQTKTNDLFGGAFVTVTEVSSSPDLSYVKAYLSILNAPSNQVILAIIQDNNKLIRKELANKIKNAVRIIPELQFFEDESLEKVAKFEKIFENLRKERESRNTEE
jgi:ribosome-binding factor A